VTDRKREILDVAMDLVVMDGVASLTMKRVADAMGFSEAAMYRHFDGKQDLIINLVRLVSGRFQEIFNDVDMDAVPAEFFSTLLGRILQYIERTRGVSMMFFSESTYNRDVPVREELADVFGCLIGYVSEYLESGMSSGVIRRGLDCDSGAVLFIGIIQSVTIQYILSDYSVSVDSHGSKLLDIYLQGIVS
jgi:AcrR family transcriptional regulator